MKAIFWDRDGVLNHVLAERKSDGHKNVSPQTFAEFKLISEASEVLLYAKEQGFLNVIATKQPDIARGKMSWDELNKMHEYLQKHIPYIDGIYICPHDKQDGCHCRKPKPGLLLDAAKDLHINLNESFMVGDMQSDIDAGRNAGVKTILIRTPYNTEAVNFDFAVENISEIKNIIKNRPDLYA